MAEDTKGSGSSFTGKYDTETKTARPTSVGPHHARREQEDPGNPGIKPEQGYASEIAQLNDSSNKGARSSSGPVNIGVKGGAEDEDDKPRPEAPGEGMGKHAGGSSLPDA